MQKIVPHLWFDKEAKEAANFYVEAFGGDSKVTSVSSLDDTPSGEVDVVWFELLGFRFGAISAGPLFKFTPAVSFFVNFDPSKDPEAEQNLRDLCGKLSEGGNFLMPLQEYPFSKLYAWVQDKLGVSWQLILTNPEGEERPAIVPSFLFVGEKSGKTKEARDFYLSVFKNSKEGAIAYYEEDTPQGQKKGSVMFCDFALEDTWFAAMDGGNPHEFDFNESISFIVNCKDQEEVDYFWEKLSAVPESEQCGWLKDKYGVSWQIVPEALDKMMSEGTEEQVGRVTQAFLKMKKFDIKELEKAYNG